MKASRNIKAVGLALGERSMLVAEVAGGEKPSVRHLGEFSYPAEMSLSTPVPLGEALGAYLKELGVTARSAVIGIPARWLVVKPKDVPPADTGTLNDMLRLQAESEFSVELKDLVYDYAGVGNASAAGQVLLIATQRQTIDSASVMCEAAKLNAVSIMPTSVALGTAVGRGGGDSLVMFVGSSGAELLSQRAGVASAIRHLRGPVDAKPFVGELRRAVASVPGVASVNGSSNGSPRELVIWNGGAIDPAALAGGMGVTLRIGQMDTLDVDSSEVGSNGQPRPYAVAVALALAAVHDDAGVDFLHSRLAPPAERRIPQWAYAAALALVLIIVSVVYGYHVLNVKQAELDKLNLFVDSHTDTLKIASAFNEKVSFAQAWHGGNPRYLACMRDLTGAMPNDRVTYATNLLLHETAKTTVKPVAGVKPVTTLSGTLTGKTSDQERVQALIDKLHKAPGFVYVSLGGTSDVGKTHEVSFTILFNYQPPLPPAPKAKS